MLFFARKHPIFGETPLHYACIENDLRAVKKILAKGGGVDVPDDGGQTPLISASMLGYVDMVELLLQYNANVRVKDHAWGNTALHYAAENGHVKIIKLLLAAGADKTMPNNNGHTALEMAKSTYIPMESLLK